MISMDGIVKLPTSDGLDCIQVFIDRFTKMVRLVPYCEAGFAAPELARMYLDVRIGPRVDGREGWARRGTLVTKCTESGGGWWKGTVAMEVTQARLRVLGKFVVSRW
jgi:hypothetical protein